MGLLASMGAGMDSQGRALDEAFCTIWKTAAIGSFIRMYSKVSAQIRLSVESLEQNITETSMSISQMRALKVGIDFRTFLQLFHVHGKLRVRGMLVGSTSQAG